MCVLESKIFNIALIVATLPLLIGWKSFTGGCVNDVMEIPFD